MCVYIYIEREKEKTYHVWNVPIYNMTYIIGKTPSDEMI